MAKSLKRAAAFLISASLLWGCQTSSFSALRLPTDACAGFKTWADKTAAETGNHAVGFGWSHRPGEISLRADMFTSCAEGSKCDITEADIALYEALGSRTHYVGLDDLARSISTCFNERPSVTIDEEDSPVTVRSDIRRKDWALKIHWDQNSCRAENGGVPQYEGGCLLLELTEK